MEQTREKRKLEELQMEKKYIKAIITNHITHFSEKNRDESKLIILDNNASNLDRSSTCTNNNVEDRYNMDY